MKRYICFFHFIVPLLLFGQKELEPFKVVILSPDTVIIHDELRMFIDTIQSSQLRERDASIRAMETMINATTDGYSAERKKQHEELKAKIEESLKKLRSSDSLITPFKYYGLIAQYSRSIFELVFNQAGPIAEFQIVNTTDMVNRGYQQTADMYHTDYIVEYKNIMTEKNHDRFTLQLTSVVYSRKASKVIMNKETTGDATNRGGLWTCDNPLSCLLINGVQSSSPEIIDAILALQTR